MPAGREAGQQGKERQRPRRRARSGPGGPRRRREGGPSGKPGAEGRAGREAEQPDKQARSRRGEQAKEEPKAKGRPTGTSYRHHRRQRITRPLPGGTVRSRREAPPQRRQVGVPGPKQGVVARHRIARVPTGTGAGADERRQNARPKSRTASESGASGRRPGGETAAGQRRHVPMGKDGDDRGCASGKTHAPRPATPAGGRL